MSKGIFIVPFLFAVVGDRSIPLWYHCHRCIVWNLVSWNGGAPKYDIRDWSEDHTKMGKGVTLTAEQAKKLGELLTGI